MLLSTCRKMAQHIMHIFMPEDNLPHSRQTANQNQGRILVIDETIHHLLLYSLHKPLIS